MTLTDCPPGGAPLGPPGDSRTPGIPLVSGAVGAPEGTARLFLAASTTLAAHRAAYGDLPTANADSLIDQLRLSSLDGRGGAAFPVWRKLASTREHSGRAKGRRPIVIANGSEGEPLSRKDMTLMTRAPHLVIDGLLLAAAAVGAPDLHLYVSARAADAARLALDERPDARHVTLVTAPDAFVAGEATAVANAIERGVSVPRDHVVHLSESGVRKRPTLVQNVETLAQLALIARFGADWFRSVGTSDEPGTRLVTVTGDVPAPQVLEVAGGTALVHLLAAAGAGPGELRAVLVGGYHGGWVPAEHVGAPFSKDGLRMFGAAPGAGVLMALAASSCGLAASALIADYLAAQTAGQCGPCVNGLPALAGVLRRLAGGAVDAALPAEIARLADLVTGRGSCSHPDGTARFVLSTLTAFADDVDAHLHGRCVVNP
ncbi:NADH-ubiquinone oxidoreductase-F iron-sulfur binding region domain-containing protein [Subtercola boreus]|uniref:NADH-ubiquinone oxidoreductase 51kDa subunit iron-sulphur binding domain-containing protein n=1 Tax=Subtercola boreus TaxID=120213 RepID=A0A3E0WD39_9MICO|nr:NADH-ubiquinone oxidoreductase-F iron-sulfur binding region domain-containing protein [Subtercola boreus]RFA20613.1 hypothetical protein B7R24_09285 [Subtercola boreus]RFA20727.1 hypothetical protein B7R23_09220 [Subtercola boreus]RFA26938.1 hypothetical protein B7R25_09350 [Subtercola boreus]